MARNMYGATSADFTLTSGGRVVPGATLTIWSARTGGTQITDLLDVDSVATTTVTSDADGSIVYYGPNNDKTVHWADSGVGSRIAIRPVDITGEAGPGSGILTTKGDVMVRSASADTRLPVGTDGQMLVVDSAATTGLKWTSNTVGNLLTPNQASVETDATGLGVTNNTGTTAVARVTSDYYVGAASLRLTAGEAASSPAAGTPRDAGSAHRVLVTPGETYTAHAMVKSATRSMRLLIIWWTSGGSLVSFVNTSGVACTSWTRLSVTGVAPATAAYCSVEVDMTTSGSGTDTAFIDALGLWKGTGGQWAMPGQPILGLTDAPIGNLLTLNMAKPVTTGAYNSLGGCTEGAAGVYTATGSGAMEPASSTYTIPVTVGETVSHYVKATSVGRSFRAALVFLDASGVLVNTAFGPYVSGTGISIATGVVPAGAAKLGVYAFGTNTGSAGNTVTLIEASIHKGAAGVYAAPGLPIVGQSHIATNGAVHLSGTGTPEGVVTAAPGSTWLQTDATTDVKGWLRWVKATGTGNTGWVAGPEADTGWRNVAALLATDATTKVQTWSAVRLRRQGTRVSMYVAGVVGSGTANGTANGFQLLTAMPTGFWGLATNEEVGWLAHAGRYPCVVSYGSTNAYPSIGAPTNGNWTSSAISGQIDYQTANAWPSSLPGSAA